MKLEQLVLTRKVGAMEVPAILAKSGAVSQRGRQPKWARCRAPKPKLAPGCDGCRTPTPVVTPPPQEPSALPQLLVLWLRLWLGQAARVRATMSQPNRGQRRLRPQKLGLVLQANSVGAHPATFEQLVWVHMIGSALLLAALAQHHCWRQGLSVSLPR